MEQSYSGRKCSVVSRWGILSRMAQPWVSAIWLSNGLHFFLYSTHEPRSFENCQWGNLFRIMDMINDGWGNHFFKDYDSGIALEYWTAWNMVLVHDCHLVLYRMAITYRKAVLYLENFSLDERLWNCTNWRKQKIRRAVNKSTQKLILCRVEAQGSFGCSSILSTGKPVGDDNDDDGENRKVKPYLYVYYRLPLKQQIQTATSKT